MKGRSSTTTSSWCTHDECRRELQIRKEDRWLLELVSWTWAAATLRGVSCEVCGVDERRCEVQER